MRPLKQLILEHVTPRYLTLPMVALLLACDPMGDFLGPDTDCLMCIQPTPPVAFAVSPDSANILMRDTLTLSAWRCPTGCLLNNDPVVSVWTITGDAVVPTNAPVPLSPTSRVRLRGVALGESMITAVASDDDTKRQTVRIRVADSSAITSIALRTCCNGKDTVVAYGDVLPSMLDQEGRRYRAAPTQWSVSDSSMITLGDSSRFGPSSRTIRVHKQGMVEIRAAFLNVEGRVQLFVRP